MNSTITTDEFAQTIEWIWDLIHTYKVIPLSTGDTAQNMFLARNSVFCWIGPYLTPTYHKQKMNYRLMPVPYNGENPEAKSTTWIGTLGLAISKSTKQPAAALALMKYLCLNENAQKNFYTRGQLMPNLKTMALDANAFLSETDSSVELWPDNRYVYCDIVDGFGGDTRRALGKTGEDKIGAKVRPHYHTFENSWLNALTMEISETYGYKSKDGIKEALKNFNPLMQAYLDQSNKSAGITKK
jgi:multiple sugar transport system substrate-binding protein